MKSDLDSLMRARGLDALIVFGGEDYTAVIDYLANGAHVTNIVIVKKQDQDPLLIVSGMETEEAAKSGYPVKSMAELGYFDLMNEHADDADLARVKFYGNCLAAAGATEGTVGWYGALPANESVVYFARISAEFPQYQFKGETGRTIFDEAFLTKDNDELERIRSVAVRTNEVLQATWDFIASHQADEEGIVRNTDGEALTIGAVKQFVRRALNDRQLEDCGMIFAQGRDAGFPHSRGEAGQALRVGQSIVFDLFPRERGGGYFHDVTRTWCIGHAPEEVQQAYDEVMTAFDMALEDFGIGKPTHLMQEKVQDYFERNGHATRRSDSAATNGYVHSLGHGVGLNIHERPSISHIRKDDVWQVGNVVTIEPGLYYPEKGFGVRVEDLLIVNEQGELLSLTTFRKDLVLPLQNT